MQETTNLKLKKPDLTDYVNVSDLNDNADAIDAAVTENKDNLTTHMADYVAFKNSKGQPNGLATLDQNSAIPLSQLKNSMLLDRRGQLFSTASPTTELTYEYSLRSALEIGGAEVETKRFYEITSVSFESNTASAANPSLAKLSYQIGNSGEIFFPEVSSTTIETIIKTYPLTIETSEKVTFRAYSKSTSAGHGGGSRAGAIKVIGSEYLKMKGVI